MPEFEAEIAIAKKIQDGGVMLWSAERDAAGAYQLAGDTPQALIHCEQAEHQMRNAWKHRETSQVKDVRRKSLKQTIEKHAAFLEQTGRSDEAAALRREASQI